VLAELIDMAVYSSTKVCRVPCIPWSQGCSLPYGHPRKKEKRIYHMLLHLLGTVQKKCKMWPTLYKNLYCITDLMVILKLCKLMINYTINPWKFLMIILIVKLSVKVASLRKENVIN